MIVPGQELKVRLTSGILWCDKLLLLWSGHSNRSEFVQWEWRRAYRLMKDIVPYALDDTPPPNELTRLVYVDRSDQKHGHAGLLRAIRGRHWKPPPERRSYAFLDTHRPVTLTSQHGYQSHQRESDTMGRGFRAFHSGVSWLA